MGGGAAGSNVYLVRSDSSWTLVDTARGHSAEAIRTATESVFGPGARPAAILLTHSTPTTQAPPGSITDWSIPWTLRGLGRRQRVAGPPRYTTWDWPAARRSVGVLAELEPRVLLPGHGRPRTDGAAIALHALARGRPRAHR